jgi:hypothetical protein
MTVKTVRKKKPHPVSVSGLSPNWDPWQPVEGHPHILEQFSVTGRVRRYAKLCGTTHDKVLPFHVPRGKLS